LRQSGRWGGREDEAVVHGLGLVAKKEKRLAGWKGLVLIHFHRKLHRVILLWWFHFVLVCYSKTLYLPDRIEGNRWISGDTKKHTHL
jgi:hypothetical protein